MFKPGKRPLVMGIINATPDSFHDGGAYEDLIARGKKMLDDGADCLDIGGESTRPSAEPVGLEEELRRVIPLVEALSSIAPVSIDTSKGPVAIEAARAGATVLNDVRGLQDPAMIAASAKFQIAVVMHSRGTPKTMRSLNDYENMIEEVGDFLDKAAKRSQADTTWIDPGIGFAKSARQSLVLLNKTEEFVALGHPVLIGASRKSFIGQMLDQPNTTDRLCGSLAAVAAAFYGGAKAFRVHDVRETREMLDLLQAIVETE